MANEEKYEQIINDMPNNLTDMEKARYIYIELGKYFSYDEKYYIANSEEKVEMFNMEAEDVENDMAICTTFAKVYEMMLRRVGINANTVIINGKSEDRLGHGFTEFEIEGKKYFSDLTHDRMYIKTGFKTNNFGISNPDISEENFQYTSLSEDELKKIDDKIGYTYKRYVYGRCYRNVKK